MIVQGNSMFPFLKNRDEVLLSPAKQQELKRGDIVLAKTEIGIILHRIIRWEKDGVVLAGDGNISQIEHALFVEIYGVVQHAYRHNSDWNVSSAGQVFLWQLWHFLCPFRRLLIPTFKLFTKQNAKK